MEENATLRTVLSSIQALGRDFDLNKDIRLLYCKEARLVDVDEEHLTDLEVGDGLVARGVSRDVRCSREIGGRESFGPCSFQEMTEYFNRKALLSGTISIGSFNSAFSFTGSKKTDAFSTKSLAMVGRIIPLCKLQLAKNPSSIREDVKRAVPVSWEPLSLARFVESYGTHVVTSITIGGKDVAYINQHSSSSTSIMEIKSYIQDIGDQRFSETGKHSGSGPLKMNDIFQQNRHDVSVIFRRRGGDDLVQNNVQWAKTVSSAPDVIEMSFVPITSLLDKFPGKGHLARAINLYLEYKPPIEELRYFLEFQVAKIWAPVRDNLPGLHRKDPVCPSLQFSLMSQKLYISQEQVSVGRKPITGLRLCLEGAKQNHLCIHVQHLATLPKILQPFWESHIAIGAARWHGPEEQDSHWFEPVKWKNYSHVCTAAIEHNETFIDDLSGSYVATGAQLGVWDFRTKSVLFLKLLYLKVPQCTIRRSLWDQTSTSSTGKYKRMPSLDSATAGDSSSGSGNEGKLTKFVDISEKIKGPDDLPGHWLVTGGKLAVEKGKIVLQVKYSLLNY